MARNAVMNGISRLIRNIHKRGWAAMSFHFKQKYHTIALHIFLFPTIERGCDIFWLTDNAATAALNAFVGIFESILIYAKCVAWYVQVFAYLSARAAARKKGKMEFYCRFGCAKRSTLSDFEKFSFHSCVPCNSTNVSRLIYTHNLMSAAATAAATTGYANVFFFPVAIFIPAQKTGRRYIEIHGHSCRRLPLIVHQFTRHSNWRKHSINIQPTILYAM